MKRNAKIYKKKLRKKKLMEKIIKARSLILHKE